MPKYLKVDVDELYKEAEEMYPGRKLLSTEEVAELERVSPKRVQNASSASELAGTGRGKLRMYPIDEVVMWRRKRRERSMQGFRLSPSTANA